MRLFLHAFFSCRIEVGFYYPDPHFISAAKSPYKTATVRTRQTFHVLMIYWHNGLWWKVKSTWKRKKKEEIERWTPPSLPFRRKGVGMPSFPIFSISKFGRDSPKPMCPLMHLFYRVLKTRCSQLKGGQRYWKSHSTIGDSFPTLVDSFMENIQLPI